MDSRNVILSALNENEKLALYKAPIYLALYAALEDGHIDKEEIEDANTLVHYRTFTSHKKLHEFYKFAEEGFEEGLEREKENLPKDADQARKIINEKLDGIEQLLQKLDNYNQKIIRESFKSFAAHVARASKSWLDELSLFVAPFMEDK